MLESAWFPGDPEEGRSELGRPSKRRSGSTGLLISTTKIEQNKLIIAACVASPIASLHKPTSHVKIMGRVSIL